MVDKNGLQRTYMTLGQISEALRMHLEDAHRELIDDLRGLDEALEGIDQAQDGIRSFLRYTEECAVCDGMLKGSERAEVVFKDDPEHKHHIIHQSCFRTFDHEIA